MVHRSLLYKRRQYYEKVEFVHGEIAAIYPLYYYVLLQRIPIAFVKKDSLFFPEPSQKTPIAGFQIYSLLGDYNTITHSGCAEN